MLANYLLEQEENFNLPQVLGALSLLDAGRKIRAAQSKLKKLEAQVEFRSLFSIHFA